MKTGRTRTILTIGSVLVIHSEGADINVVIPGGGSGSFSTNINVYSATLGFSTSLRVTPANCFHFKALPNRAYGGVTVVDGTINHCEANYTMTLTSTNRQGWIAVSGQIEPSNECGNCGTGGGGTAQSKDYAVSVTQRVAWAYFTLPSNGTNLTACAGCTNDVELKVLLGDAGIPSAGTGTFSLSSSSLGSFTVTNVALSGSGLAKTSFIGSTNGGSGTITAASATGSLKDEAGKIVPDVSTNLTVNNVEITGVTAQGAVSVTNIVGNQKILHFVTPKGAANTTVTLTATINPNNQQVKDVIDWDGATENATDPLKATVPKDVAAKKVVKIKVNGQVCKEMRVWIVWSDATTQDVGATQVTFEGANNQNTRIGPTVQYKFTISPAEIVTDADRPNLQGNKGSNPPNVPADLADVFRTGEDISGGADLRWDVSRQRRQRVIDPAKLRINSAEEWTTRLKFPKDENGMNADDRNVVGNDDRTTDDGEDNNPYPDDPNGGGDGVLIANDGPFTRMFGSEGNVGDTFTRRDQFLEFARINIVSTWYRISDFYPWRSHEDFKKVDEAVDNVDYNGDGDKVDKIWIDGGGSVADKTNDGL